MREEGRRKWDRELGARCKEGGGRVRGREDKEKVRVSDTVGSRRARRKEKRKNSKRGRESVFILMCTQSEGSVSAIVPGLPVKTLWLLQRLFISASETHAGKSPCYDTGIWMCTCLRSPPPPPKKKLLMF